MVQKLSMPGSYTRREERVDRDKGVQVIKSVVLRLQRQKEANNPTLKLGSTYSSKISRQQAIANFEKACQETKEKYR